MSESAEMSVNRKIAVGILSVFTVSFIGAGIYFLSKKTDKTDHQENFSNDGKGYAFLFIGIFFLIATIITVINPKFKYNPYIDPYFQWPSRPSNLPLRIKSFHLAYYSRKFHTNLHRKSCDI
jgi:hypothetical protein